MSMSLLIVIGSALVGLGVIGIGVGVVVFLLIRNKQG